MDKRTLDKMINRMEVFPGALSALLEGVTDDEARLKPATGAWSIVEIVTHLVDEESEDFRTRVRRTLDDPSQAWPSIDPEGVAIEREYNKNSLNEMLERFRSERDNSVQWLRTLSDPDWSQTYSHPSIGSLQAGDVFVSWCAHDALHLRQIAKRLYELTQRGGDGYKTDYAGDW